LLVRFKPPRHDGSVAKPVGADKKRRATTPNQVFGRAVTEKRIAQNLPQASLAAALGYSNYYVGRIERGQANITCDVMFAVGSYFKMSIGQFWTFAESLPKKFSGPK
jgi:plasmid maintenance system antidote protein VapI